MWLMPVILTLGKLRQEDYHEFQPRLQSTFVKNKTRVKCKWQPLSEDQIHVSKYMFGQALVWQKQAGFLIFKVTLVYIGSSRSARVIMYDPIYRQINKKT